MSHLLLRRILISVAVLFLVSALVFVLESLLPGDAARAVAGPNATPADIATLRRQLGLDRPLLDQYWSWLTGFVHGDLGSSLENQQAVVNELDSRLPVTLALVIGSTVLSTVVGVALGVLSSTGSGPLAKIVDVVSIAGLAAPAFWVALVLISVLSVDLGLVPATGYVSFTDSPSGWAQTLVTPVVALALGGTTAIAKQTREAMMDALGSDFVRNLRANGSPERVVVLKHALRSSAVRVITMSGLILIGALGGSVVIEQIFGLPGLGSLAVSATSAKDLPVIQGIAVYFTLIVVAANLLIDLAYGWIDPRVRTS